MRSDLYTRFDRKLNITKHNRPVFMRYTGYVHVMSSQLWRYGNPWIELDKWMDRHLWLQLCKGPRWPLLGLLSWWHIFKWSHRKHLKIDHPQISPLGTRYSNDGLDCVIGYQVSCPTMFARSFRQVSIISRTQSQHLRYSYTVLRLSLPNPLKPDVKSRMKMLLEQRRQAMLQLHLSDRQINCLRRGGLY